MPNKKSCGKFEATTDSQSSSKKTTVSQYQAAENVSFSNQKAVAVKRSITPLGHFKCMASHFWETVPGIAGANHLKA